ncbi:hypothetical protein PTTG_11760 [Puccinia triticina 1-1 BBBD Race 1]|uniref:Anaphase-promoting complex subunit 4 n=2 Tax=Puccinia triticina TaxID=208348 RepID=A0A180GM52_PUCT1|nr:uncharacterized protein PtA15_3A615 [Puccinia triticina]OAV93548.1 hypothetical protein PTTG_11760 [Puccinia triticina 1-1 BBBD Race 1]WAQ83246.1 hypothetical protein PtA15_3A615 [Puccinia triticina]
MDQEAFTSLSHRILSFPHRLSHQACCPTMDLAVLTSPSTGTDSAASNQSTSHDDTISCFRLSGSTPQVWSASIGRFFTDNCACVDLLGYHVELDPDSRFDEITALHWSPDGQSLVAGVSSTSPARPATFILLSVHSGQLLAFPTVVTSSDLNLQSATPLHSGQPSHHTKLGFFAWLSIRPSKKAIQEPAQSTTDARSIGQSLCDRLPANLTVTQLTKIETMRSHMGPVYTSNPSTGTSKVYDHYPMIRFPPCLAVNQQQPKERPNTSSLLIVSSHINTLHFFLDGTIYLGTTTLPSQVQLVGVQLLEQDSSSSIPLDDAHLGGIRLQLVWLDKKHSIGFGTLDLLPSLLPSHPSSNKSSLHLNVFKLNQRLSLIGINSKELNQQAQLSNEIQSLLKDSFFAYFGIVKDWHIARVTAKKWYENLEQLSKTHKVAEPISFQMLQLLFLGQATEGLRDFLGTKSGDRIFSKWESAVSASLTRIRLAIMELFVPAVERLYILTTELRLHTYPKFSSIKMIEDDDFETLLVVDNLIKHLIKAVHMLDQLVKEEEDLFGHFCKWLRSEFDYIVALENAPTPPSRPLIKYDLMAVSKFIQRGEANPLDNVIFSQFRSKTDDFKYLHAVKEQLSKAVYDDHFDDNAHPADRKTDQNSEPFVDDSPILGTYVTPDSSHLQPHSNAEFLTPSLGDHLKRQKDVAITPSNPSMFKPFSSSTSGSNPQFNTSSHQSSESGVNDSPNPSSQPPWGLYNSLTYSSMLIAEVFVKMFSKIAMAKPVQENTLLNTHSLLKPADRHICSRFVEDFHYSAFLSEQPEGVTVLVIDRIELPSETPMGAKLAQTQVTIELALPGGHVEDNHPERTIKVLDLDFFDDLEVVLLAQFDSGFSAKYMMITMRFRELFDENQRHFTELPVYRNHRLESDYQPDQMSLNGARGRRTGCVLSGQGRKLHVFDMEDISDS